MGSLLPRGGLGGMGSSGLGSKVAVSPIPLLASPLKGKALLPLISSDYFSTRSGVQGTTAPSAAAGKSGWHCRGRLPTAPLRIATR
jgi:hypothetical protein